MTAAMPLARPGDQAVSPFAGADVCRLAGLRLLPGRRGPAFGDEVWDFTAVDGLPVQMQPSYRRWDFTVITTPAWRLVAREQLMALLAPRHEAVAVLARASRTPLHLRTCQLRFTELVRLLNWLPARGVVSLGQLTSEHCQAYLTWRREIRGADGRLVGQRGPTTALRAASAVTGLVSYRELFTADRPPAGLRPFGGATAAQAAQLTRNAACKTQPVPDSVLQPMLTAALYLTGTLGPHITGLASQIAAAERHRAGLPRPGMSIPAARLTAALQHHLDHGDPLPRLPGHDVAARLAAGWRPGDPLLTVNLDMIARQAGVTEFRSAWIPAMRALIAETAARVGIERSSGRAAQMAPRPDGRGELPWTLPLDQRRAAGLARTARTACLIVIAAISGMRASELMELTVSSALPPAQAGAALVRYRLASRLVKGQPLGGTADEWVVIQPVHQAAGLAAALLGEDTPPAAPLFGRFTFGHRYQAFRSWVNGPGQRLGLAPIPAGKVTPQALRRTLALQLAHRPGGLLAAKIHLKHVSVATTEGYAARPGGAQARLLAQINTEETERNLGLALAEFRNYQRGVMPAGPGARELTALFARIDTAITTPGDAKVHNSDRDILNLLSRQAATLHLGIANYCWFTDPSRALCLQLAGTPGASQPLTGMCDSARCPQATHHPRHRDVWASHAAATKTFLGALGRTRTTERARLQADYDRAVRVIAGIDAAAPPAATDPEHTS